MIGIYNPECLKTRIPRTHKCASEILTEMKMNKSLYEKALKRCWASDIIEIAVENDDLFDLYMDLFLLGFYKGYMAKKKK